MQMKENGRAMRPFNGGASNWMTRARPEQGDLSDAFQPLQVVWVGIISDAEPGGSAKMQRWGTFT